MFFEPLLLGFPDYQLQGKNLARLLKIEYGEAELHQFPDGESKIRLPVDIPSTVVICRSLDSPNNKLIELFFIAKELRQKGCEHIILVAPYLCYMRQDKAFEPGEAVSQRWVGKLLSGQFKNLWSYRVGDIRIIADIQQDALIMLVLEIARRDKVYKK